MFCSLVHNTQVKQFTLATAVGLLLLCFSWWFESTFEISDSDVLNVALIKSMKAMWPHIINCFCGLKFHR